MFNFNNLQMKTFDEFIVNPLYNILQENKLHIYKQCCWNWKKSIKKNLLVSQTWNKPTIWFSKFFFQKIEKTFSFGLDKKQILLIQFMCFLKEFQTWYNLQLISP
jgi:hypothetical protein